MENAKDIESATNSLYEFMKVMNAWEIKYHDLYKQGGTAKHAEAARAEINEIYARFLTDRDRKLGQQSAVSVRNPPQFDPKSEPVVSVEDLGKNKILITTRWVHPSIPTMTKDLRYTMVFKLGKYLLDKREKYSTLDAKWTSVTL
jgi:NTF2 fold immunity protein